MDSIPNMELICFNQYVDEKIVILLRVKKILPYILREPSVSIKLYDVDMLGQLDEVNSEH
jgi:hypothetical protein